MGIFKKKILGTSAILLGIVGGMLSLKSKSDSDADISDRKDEPRGIHKSDSKRVSRLRNNMVADISDRNGVPTENFDIQGKLAALDSMRFGNEYQAALIEIAMYYGKFDSEGGKAWLLGLDSNPMNSPAFSIFGHSHSLTFGIESLYFISEINHGSFKDDYLKGAVPALSLSNGQDVVAFLLSNKKAIKNLEAHFSSVATAMASVDLDYSFELLSSDVVPTQYKASMYNGFFSSIATEENWGRSASTYLEKISADDNDKYLEEILTEMVARAPMQSFEDVCEVLSNAPSSTAKDHAIARFSNAIVEKAPESTPGWINEISQQNVRDRAAIQVTNKIKTFDPELSVRLLDEMNVTLEVKERLIKGLRSSEAE